MQGDARWLLPEGVEEILPQEASALEFLRRTVLDHFANWGYRQVFTPPLEFFESLMVGTGQDLASRTFSVTDPLSGRRLGFRPDMTPQVARMDAHRLHSGQLTRLCYCDDVLHTRPSRQSRQRWQIQAGAELFGEAGVNADLEVISLMCETLCALGVERPVIELGHVGLVKHLAHEARLDEDARRQYYSLVQHKARAEIAEFVDGLDVPAALSGALLSLPFAYGDWQRFDAVASSAGIAVPGIQAALAPVRSVGEALLARFPDLQLSFDLGEMRGYQYHTGLVFSAYLEGLDEAIASGGRYDGVGESFGRHRPATGFSMALKPLLGLMDIKSAETALIWAPANAPYASLAALRRAGQPVVQALDPESSAPVGSRCLIQKGQEWIVEEQL